MNEVGCCCDDDDVDADPADDNSDDLVFLLLTAEDADSAVDTVDDFRLFVVDVAVVNESFNVVVSDSFKIFTLLSLQLIFNLNGNGFCDSASEFDDDNLDLAIVSALVFVFTLDMLGVEFVSEIFESE
ncbi:hypothetical protein DERP_012739 [Dermatophagoides pteronyssinus]|uniref:Uncharacterized protein n=1 Tax=Dermatophagoides pteronyssinus TaxID=6956 RepID=A0ABQ8JQP3_DERPT|nr:hypothetical protein DERP_012739 [Dermatophagoides pteronyssinus]